MKLRHFIVSIFNVKSKKSHWNDKFQFKGEKIKIRILQ